MTKGARFVWLDQVRERVRDHTLSSQAGHVALALGVHYMNGSLEVWPSQRELAVTTGRSRRTVQRALEELEQHGLLEVVDRGRPGATSSNVYHLRMASQ